MHVGLRAPNFQIDFFFQACARLLALPPSPPSNTSPTMPAPRSSDPTGKRTKSAPSASSKPTSSSKGPDSKGKKRVRVVEPDSSDTEAVPVVEAAPKPKAAKGRKSQEAAPAVADKSRKDLRDKSLSEIAPVVSAEAPAPAKGALKKSLKKAAAAPAVGEEESAGEGTTGDDDEEEIDFLKGFESGGEDSSDEEEGEEKEFKVEELPALSREEAGVQKKLEAKAERKKNVRGALSLPFSPGADVLSWVGAGQVWNGLPWTRTAWIPRGGDAVVLLPVWRGHPPPSFAQQEGALLFPFPSPSPRKY